MQQGLESLLDARRPGGLVADLRRAGDAGQVARRAHGLDDVFAAALAGSGAAPAAKLDALMTAQQYAAKHGEVCPMDWDEGEPTMKGNFESKKDYFTNKRSKRKTA